MNYYLNFPFSLVQDSPFFRVLAFYAIYWYLEMNGEGFLVGKKDEWALLLLELYFCFYKDSIYMVKIIDFNFSFLLLSCKQFSKNWLAVSTITQRGWPAHPTLFWLLLYIFFLHQEEDFLIQKLKDFYVPGLLDLEVCAFGMSAYVIQQRL